MTGVVPQARGVVLAGLSGLLLCACTYPHETFDIPPINGTIVSAIDGVPIAGAQIVASVVNDPAVQRTAVSDAQGRFTIEPMGHTEWFRAYDAAPAAQVKIHARGYQTAEKYYATTRRFDSVVVALEREAAPQ